MFEDRYGPCSQIVIGDEIQYDSTWYGITGIAENPDDAERIDFTLNDPDTTVITWKNNKRVSYRTWIEA